MKRILNTYEASTDTRLRSICASWGARVFLKVRVADVLPIEGSGIDNHLFRFALQAHFDFVIAENDSEALFAVEFDGDAHCTPTQQRRDRKKNLLCCKFVLPILRVNSRYLQRKYGNMDLIGWFVHTWFASRAMADAQAKGLIPRDEPIDPTFSFNMPGESSRFPLWLSRDVIDYVRSLASKHEFYDPGISCIVGRDADGIMHALAYIHITQEEGVIARTAMQQQNFPVDLTSVLEDIVVREAFEKLSLVLDGEEEPITGIDGFVTDFQNRYKFLAAFAWSRERGHAA